MNNNLRKSLIMTEQELQSFREIKKRSDSMLGQSKHLALYYFCCWIIAILCIFVLSENGENVLLVSVGIGFALAPELHIAFLGIKLLANILAIKVLSFQVTNGIKEEKPVKKENPETPPQTQGTYIGGVKLEDY